MKYLLLLLLSFNSFASIFCLPEKVEDINEFVVNDRLPFMMAKLYPELKQVEQKKYDRPVCIEETLQDEEGEDYQEVTNSPCFSTQEKKDKVYYYSENDHENPSTLYERLVIKVKPELSELQAELDRWKAKKIAKIDFENRVCDIKHKGRAMKLCGYEHANKDKFMRKIFKNENLTKIECLESKAAEIKEADDAEKVKQDKIDNHKQKIKDYDCSSLSGFVKSLCIVKQGK